MHESETVTVMSESLYREETEKLFSQWKANADKGISPFVTDGVMNPSQWFSQSVRPLFLLKEAYGGDSDWDLAGDHVLANEATRKIWKRISLWSKGLIKTDQHRMEPYTPDDSELKVFGNRYLHQIAAINVKKYNGEKTSDYDEINKYAEKDKNFLKRQIEFCDPTVIVCGYTISALNIILGEDVRKCKNDGLFYHTRINGHDVIIIDYWHPANHYPEIMNYHCLMKIYQDALKDQHERLNGSET